MKRYRKKLQYPPTHRVLFCSLMQWRQEEKRDQNLFPILASGIKNKWLKVCGSSLSLSEFLGMNRVYGETSMHPLDFCVSSACLLQEPGGWITPGSPQVWWLHFLGYIKSKLPNKLSAGSVYHIDIEQLECTETWPGWKNNYVKYWHYL